MSFFSSWLGGSAKPATAPTTAASSSSSSASGASTASTAVPAMTTATAAPPAIANSAVGDGGVVYRTKTVCPKCMLLAGKGVQWVDADVVIRGEQVLLVGRCGDHGTHETLYCSSAAFFQRCMQFQYELPPTAVTSSTPRLHDLEDLVRHTAVPSKSAYMPLTMEMTVYVDDDSAAGGHFVSDDDIRQQVALLQDRYPRDRQFVVKVRGKLAHDMAELNRKTLLVAALVPRHVVLLEVSYERLVLISRLDNSAFFQPTIFPALKYFLARGDEETCMSELSSLFQSLKEFSHMQIAVTVAVEYPLPELDSVLALLRSQLGFVKFITFSLERSPADIMSSAGLGFSDAGLSQLPAADVRPGSVDPYLLLQTIASSSGMGNAISVDDFYPMSTGFLAEPFLALMGYGNFHIRPSPFCGFATCLVTVGSVYSTPISRFVNLDKMFAELAPLLPKVQGGIGLFLTKKLKKILKLSWNPTCGHPLPDVAAYFMEKSKAEDLRTFIRNMQIIVVHNNMDIGAVDIVRRCRCAVGSLPPGGGPNDVAAACTGCLL